MKQHLACYEKAIGLVTLIEFLVERLVPI